jgi:hypothetical protein
MLAVELTAGLERAVEKEKDMEDLIKSWNSYCLMNNENAGLPFVHFEAGFKAGRKSEREACAKACEETAKVPVLSDWDVTHNEAANGCASAIRARSNAKVSGAGTASAGLPGYTAGDNNTE